MDPLGWVRIVALFLVLLVGAIFLVVQSRTRRFSRGAEVTRSVVAVVAYAAVYWATGSNVSMVWSAVAIVVGLLLGYLSGLVSTYVATESGSAIKMAPWPGIMTVVGYALVAAAVMWGTSVIVSACLVIALIGVAMTVGAAAAEMVRSGAAAPSA